MLIVGGALQSVLLAWAVGVEPCGAGCLLGCKLLALCQLLFGSRSLVWVGELGEVDFVT